MPSFEMKPVMVSDTYARPLSNAIPARYSATSDWAIGRTCAVCIHRCNHARDAIPSGGFINGA